MKQLYLLFLFLGISASVLMSQPSAGDYQSLTTGNWNSNSSWQRHNGTTWVNANAGVFPTDTSGVITILSGDVITITAALTIDETTIDNGGSVVLNSGQALTVANGTGDDLTIAGTFTNNSSFTIVASATIQVDSLGIFNATTGSTISGASTTTMYFNGGSTYDHQLNFGLVPAVTWDANSTCLITGTTNSPPFFLGQSFGNFTYNCPGQTGTLNLGMTSSTSIAGDLTVADTKGKVLAFSNTASTTITVSGDWITTGNSRPCITTTGNNVILNVLGDYNNASTNNSSNYLATSGTGTLNVTGNFSQSDGKLQGNSTSMVNFVGTSVQNFTDGGTFTFVNFTVKNDAILDLGTSAVSGTGSFTVEGNATIKVGSLHGNGAIQNATNAGNIWVSGTRTYTTPCDIVYNGSGAQELGDGFPSTGGVNLEIDNTDGVTLSADQTFGSSDSLIFTSGYLGIGANTFTFNGEIFGTSSFSGGATSNLSIGGTGALGSALSFESASSELNNFTINRSSSTISLGSDLTVSGTLTHTSGTLNFNDDRLQISGVYSNTSQSFVSNSSSVLEIDGSGAFGTLNITTALDTLIIDRSATTISPTSALTVDAIVITSGTLTTTNTTLTDGGAIHRSADGTLTSLPGGIGQFSVEYTGAGTMTTGTELPASPSTRLLNLTNNASDVTLNKNIIINGTALFNSGTFSASTYTIDMNGSTWNDDNGGFSPGTSTIDLNSTTSIIGTSPLFNSLNLTSGADITFPSDASVELTGNLTINATAVLAQAPDEFLFNGTVDQTITANGDTIPVIAVSKTGGDLIISTELNISQRIQIQSATTLSSAGNLVLLSTASQDASVEALPAGASITGNVTVQRYVDAEGSYVWRHISSPIRGATVSDLAGYFWTFNPVYYYDETLPGTLNDRWVKATSSTALTPTQGFIVVGNNFTTPVNWESVGVLFQGDTTVNLDLTSAADLTNNGWNFVGNPYPSSIDWSSGAWTKVNINGAAYVRDFASGVYLFNDGTGSSTFNGIIPTGQGFWVHADKATPVPSLSFAEATKTTTTGTFYRKGKPEIKDRIVAVLTNGKFSDKAFINFKKKASDGYDQTIDNFKMNNEIFNIATVSEEGYRFCIDYRKKTKDQVSINLDLYNFKKDHRSYNRFNFSQPQNYTLSFEDIESLKKKNSVHLIDHYLNKEYDLRKESSFTILIDPGIPETHGDARFEIVINDKEEEDEIDLSSQDELIVYPNPAKNKITIKFKKFKDVENSETLDFNIIDPRKGSIVANGSLYLERNNYIAEVNVSRLKKGVYLVQVFGDNKIYYFKFVKK